MKRELLLLSSSSIASFKRCRKQYDLQYERLLKPRETKEVIENGTAFHEYAKRFNCGLRLAGMKINFMETGDPMLAVWRSYQKYKMDDYAPIFVDEPLWIELSPQTWVRWTPDVVFKRGDFIVGRDYKTFAKQPNIDVDLDFQGRFYTAALMRHFKTQDVWFEYECVRQTPPGIPHNRAGDTWTPEECYTRVPLVISKREADELWSETVEVAEDIRSARLRGGPAWYRQDQKGWNGCTGCFMRHACSAEAQRGYLDDGTIDLYYDRGKPLELPEGLK